MIRPPGKALAFLRWFCREDYLEEIEGDLTEVYRNDFTRHPRKAKFKFTWSVIRYFRPEFIKTFEYQSSNTTGMYKNYFRTALQNIRKNKMHAVINVSGLAIGISVAIIISLWIFDELSYNKQFANHERIGLVAQNVVNNNVVETWLNTPWPLADEIRKNYGTDFRFVSAASHNYEHTFKIGEEKYVRTGMFVEPDFISMLEPELISGTVLGSDPSAILLSASTANAFFGSNNPVGKTINMDDIDFQIGGVYKDFPDQSGFGDVFFLGLWSKFVVIEDLESMEDPWRPNAFQVFVMLNDHSDFKTASLRIKDTRLKKVNEELAKKKPELFIHAMDDWHLRADFENGKQTGGQMQYVWMFGLVGVFVLLMACINFMNLSTARSEKRAKEVGIRKATGSRRGQLITQFFSESTLTAFLSLLVAMVLAQLLLPLFNGLAEKTMTIPWGHPLTWVGIIAASIFIGIVAGSYPAFYLSAIRPVDALKGGFKAGPGASVPRKILVVVQFVVSVIMIIGTLTVFLQINYVKQRPLGYQVNGLISIPGITRQVNKHADAIRKTLIDNESILEMTECFSPSTYGSSSSSRIDWSGKDPNLSVDFVTFYGSYEYGKTINWELLQGRDFSRDFRSDSSGVILNEAAAQYLGRQNIVGETMMIKGQACTILGVVKNVVFGNPYQPVKPSLYLLTGDRAYFLMARLNPKRPAVESLANIEAAVKPHMNGEPYSFEFLDSVQAGKFQNEERVSTLVGTFTGLAIFISCLGIFGLSSFVAEQRTKEIGIRKVMGATATRLWMMLSSDFVLLVVLASFIAVPIAWYIMSQWLMNYEYRMKFSWPVFVLPTIGAILITLATVSFQTLKASIMNPVNSLRSE